MNILDIYKILVNFEVLLLQGAFISFWGAFIREVLLRDKHGSKRQRCSRLFNQCLCSGLVQEGTGNFLKILM